MDRRRGFTLVEGSLAAALAAVVFAGALGLLRPALAGSRRLEARLDRVAEVRRLQERLRRDLMSAARGTLLVDADGLGLEMAGPVDPALGVPGELVRWCRVPGPDGSPRLVRRTSSPSGMGPVHEDVLVSPCPALSLAVVGATSAADRRLIRVRLRLAGPPAAGSPAGLDASFLIGLPAGTWSQAPAGQAATALQDGPGEDPAAGR